MSPNLRAIALAAGIFAGASAGCEATDTVQPVPPPDRGGRRVALDLGLAPLDGPPARPSDAALPDSGPLDGESPDGSTPDGMGFDGTPDDGQNGQ